MYQQFCFRQSTVLWWRLCLCKSSQTTAGSIKTRLECWALAKRSTEEVIAIDAHLTSSSGSRRFSDLLASFCGNLYEGTVSANNKHLFVVEAAGCFLWDWKWLTWKNSNGQIFQRKVFATFATPASGFTNGRLLTCQTADEQQAVRKYTICYPLILRTSAHSCRPQQGTCRVYF
jgi:hypothetical protein